MEEKSMSNTRKILTNICFGIKVSYEASPLYFLLKCIVIFANTIVPLVSLLIWRSMINSLVKTSKLEEIGLLLGIYIGLQMFVYLAGKFNNYIIDRYYDARTFYIENIMLKSVAHIDLAYFESSSFADKLNHIRNSFGALHDTAWIVFDVITGVINIVLTFFIISDYHIWLGILIFLLQIPYCVYNKCFTHRMYRLKKGQTRDSRLKSFYDSAFQDNELLFEMKLNQIGKYFIKKSSYIFENIFISDKNENGKHLLKSSFLIVLSYLGELLILLFSINDVIKCFIGVGDLQYNLSISNRLHTQIIKLMDDINVFMVNNTQINELKDFMEITPKHTHNGNLVLTDTRPKIEFCNVTFKYPNTDNYVLKNCSFLIESNEKVGLLGLNGAGKSTIIKLIFGFYDVEEGCVKINDIDIKEYDIYSVRKVFGVLFQEYVTYCLPLREIIALSDYARRFDDERLLKACKTSGADSIIQDFEKKFDTVIGRYYADNGKDFSGGQWQLISLARAYFKDCDYMILDEPSAALDPISEDRIFEQLYCLSEGKSSITISHRLSNTMLADRILVIDDGSIIEQGTHFELMKRNGKYANMFNLQASKYI